MSIPAELIHRHAFHFTHLDNLASIIKGGILSTNIKKANSISHESVADEGIQFRRSTMNIPCCPGRVVHDFVPFYFSKKTSMQLGVINKKNVDQPLLIYFAVPITVIERVPGVVFSDASANTNPPPNFYDGSQSSQLGGLNWGAIDERKWGCPSDLYRHQKMAELLMPDRVDISQIDYIVVWNEQVKAEVERVFKEQNAVLPLIKYDEDHYYMNFYEGKRESIVAGPRVLKWTYESTVEKICSAAHGAFKFNSVKEALDAIDRDFCSIKELADLDGLKASYGPHSDEVGVHSKKVAGCVMSFPEYAELSDANKDIVRLSAYLHDIGKGPKSRWPTDGMKQADNNHAVKSLPMLERILTQDIGGLDRESVRKIVMLVTYDDLVGDIVAKERDERQLFAVINSKDDLNMLVCLGKADMFSINRYWPVNNSTKIDALKAAATKRLAGV